jgi:transcriptional regulator with XRE-family HTH domain
MFPIGCYIKVNIKIVLQSTHMSNIKILVGNRIKYFRSKEKISQEELANSAMMARGFVSGVETGKRNITVETLGKIIEVLGVSYAEFFNDKNFQNKSE